ncbi:hypothetical protein Vretimale_1167 [Volvox reticuliferus]|uniref:Nucleotide-diphospho-sugar transferase domain-containing protein n=1 Tax=Volvox reticuliferus TaxID=1737510 RepID=A0A8J4D400_9CHLO|nr:hypothetical protein Vretifemale_10290 [Volvox reticuliferus]GIL95111.1 hypothetical protein Vretimale_1167 [Volvox reticuliferus]
MCIRCIENLSISLEKLLLLLLAAACMNNISAQHISRTRNQNQQEQRQWQRQLLSLNPFQNLAPASCEDVYLVNPKARESQSCSIGVIKRFTGPLNSWADLKALLQARSFRGEIILTHETQMDAIVQWIWRMRRMGYAHTVIAARGEHLCGQLSKVFGEELGCVWFPRSISYSAVRAAQTSSSQLQPQLALNEVALFLEEPAFIRLQLAAMVLRLGGYNVLALDSDVLLQDDFYWWTGQPDYRDYQLLVQRDVTGGPNTGVMYARGASPSGPIAWALAEGLMRNIRWKEQPQLPPTFNSTFTTCWEQAVVADSIYSALVGRPIFLRCLDTRQLDRTWNVREDGRTRFVDANINLIEPALIRRSFSMSRPGPSCHSPLVGPEGLWALEGKLKLPHFRGVWPDALGGRALGESGGTVSRAFQQMMREAGPPFWPDPEDPSTEAAADAVPTERFTQMSRHLVCDWASCGSQGMFLLLRNPDGSWAGEAAGTGGRDPEQREPCVVVGHLGMTPDKALGKRLQLMANGHYNMALMAAVHGPGGPYFATNSHLTGLAHFSSAMRAGMLGFHARRGQMIPAPRVIALQPGALSPGPDPTAAAGGAAVAFSGGGGSGDMSPLVLASKSHMISVMEALSSVAAAAGRTLGLPRLSCDYAWMHQDGPAAPAAAAATVVPFQNFNGSHHVPWTYLAGQAFAPYGSSLDALSCEWLAFAHHGCLHGPIHMERIGHMHANPHPAARMLLSYEMDYLLRQLPPEETTQRAVSDADATTATAGFHGGSGGNLLVVPPGSAAGPDGVFNVTLAQLTDQLSRIDPDKTIVWMERPMRVVDLQGTLRVAHQQWVTHCCGLSWPQSHNHLCFWEY